MKVLMIGATGEFAGMVLPQLIQQGIEVRAMLRDGQQADRVKKRGATETVIGDLLDINSLDKAIKDMDGVFHINPAMSLKETDMGVNMVTAAQKAGVKKFVFSAVYHPSLSMRNHRSKAPVEEALYDSDMDFTILQPSSFFQNLNNAWQTIIKTGKYALPFSKTKEMSFIDYRDVAEVAAKAFTDPSLCNGTFELSSAPSFNRIQVAEIMSRVANRKIEAADITFEEWQQHAKLPEGELLDGLKAMYEYYDKYGFRGGNDLVLKTILGREPRTLENYIGELAAKTKEAVAV